MGQRLTTMGRRTTSSQKEQKGPQRRLQRFERLGSILSLLLRLLDVSSAMCSVHRRSGLAMYQRPTTQTMTHVAKIAHAATDGPTDISL